MSMESWSTKSRRRKPPDVFTHLLTRPPKLADLAEHLAKANASTADSHSTRLAADLDRLRTIERDWISDRNPSTTWFPTADQKEAFTNVSASSSTLAQPCIDLASIWGELAEQALVLAESWTEFADKGVSGTG